MSDHHDDLLRIEVERTGTTVRIAARGELDISTVDLLREHTTRQLAGDCEIVVIDLADVTFIDSSGLHAILEAAQDDPQRLRVIPGAAASRLFGIVGVSDRLPLVADGGVGVIDDRSLRAPTRDPRGGG